MLEIVVDGRFQGGHALEDAAANAPSRDRREEPFDLIEPARARGREVQVIARMTHKPPDDVGGFVRTVVIHDHVHVPIGGQLGVHPIEKLEKLLMAMCERSWTPSNRPASMPATKAPK